MRRRQVTLHLFGQFVKTDIFMGYSRSTYWTKRILTRQREIFRKVEPYLTFLNIPQLVDKG